LDLSSDFVAEASTQRDVRGIGCFQVCRDVHARPCAKSAEPYPLPLGSTRDSGRRWLTLNALQRCVQACPSRRAAAPDVGRGPDRRRIIKGSKAHHSQTRTARGVCEELATALRTEPAANLVAAVGCTDVLGRAPSDRDGCCRKDCVDRTVRGQALAITTPANARRYGRAGQPVADGTAKTTSCALTHRVPRSM
jgi:hypothetical protein